MIKKLLLSLFLILCISATCINQNTIKDLIAPSSFIILDSYIAVQIDLGADKCFDKVDSQNLEPEEAFDKWNDCMDSYKTMESLIQSIRDNIEKGDVESFKRNFKLLVDLIHLLGLDIPDDIQKIIDVVA